MIIAIHRKGEGRIMPKKRQGRPHGHYCKICGEYKANEKFFGKGHAHHICKACSKLSAAEKAEAMTINRLMNFHGGRLTASEKNWVGNRIHDHRPEVASLAREVYNMHFPYAERNARKRQLLINTLVFELNNATIYDEYGDVYTISRRFTADRLTGILTMTDLDAGNDEQSITLEKKEMAKLLRWVIHTLEIFMWEEDYNLAPDDEFSNVPYFEVLPEYWPDDWDDDDKDEDEAPPTTEDVQPEAEIFWRVHLEYADEAEQEIVSYQDNLCDRPNELYFALVKFFKADEDDFNTDFVEEEPTKMRARW